MEAGGAPPLESSDIAGNLSCLLLLYQEGVKGLFV